MKKRVWSFFLCLIYVFALTGMLMLHIRRIDVETERFMAMLELLLLLAFCIAITLLYVKGQKDMETEKAPPDCGPGDYAYNYERFLQSGIGEGLSEREKEVAWLVCRGFTNRQIAEELFIAETTVKKHLTHVYEKCGVLSRKELKERWRSERSNG